MKYIKHLLVLAALFLLPVLTFADGSTHSGGSVTLPNPLGGTVNSLGDFVTVILNNIVLPIGSVIIVFMIIYSGFLFVTARGDTGQIDDAKHIFKYVVIGSAILLGSVAIAAAINGTLCQLAPSLPQCFVGPRLP